MKVDKDYTFLGFAALMVIVGIIAVYFDFKCGMGGGTLADIPRWCWFFKG